MHINIYIGQSRIRDLQITHIFVRCRTLIHWAKVTGKSRQHREDAQARTHKFSLRSQTSVTHTQQTHTPAHTHTYISLIHVHSQWSPVCDSLFIFPLKVFKNRTSLEYLWVTSSLIWMFSGSLPLSCTPSAHKYNTSFHTIYMCHTNGTQDNRSFSRIICVCIICADTHTFCVSASFVTNAMCITQMMRVLNEWHKSGLWNFSRIILNHSCNVHSFHHSSQMLFALRK